MRFGHRCRETVRKALGMSTSTGDDDQAVKQIGHVANSAVPNGLGGPNMAPSCSLWIPVSWVVVIFQDPSLKNCHFLENPFNLSKLSNHEFVSLVWKISVVFHRFFHWGSWQSPDSFGLPPVSDVLQKIYVSKKSNWGLQSHASKI